MKAQDLKDWRARHHCTQARLAEYLGVTRQTIINLENGTHKLSRVHELALKGLEFGTHLGVISNALIELSARLEKDQNDKGLKESDSTLLSQIYRTIQNLDIKT